MLNGFLAVSRAFGDLDRDSGDKTKGLTARPDTQRLPVSEHDEFLIVACDGLWDVFDTGEAVQYARSHLLKYNSVSGVTEALVDEALRRHSDDNITVIVVGFMMEPTDAGSVPRIIAVEDAGDEFKERPKISADGIRLMQGLLD